MITAYYAWQTRLTVKEMREDRMAADATRRRDKSEAAARRALGERPGAAAFDAAPWAGGGGAGRDLATLSTLDAEAPLIEHPNVSECVDTCSLVAFTASWPDDQLAREPIGSPAMARLRLQRVVDATRFVLEDYLRERDYEPSRWEDLPLRCVAGVSDGGATNRRAAPERTDLVLPIGSSLPP